MPVQFKTYETQARLLAAVIASNPGMKLDYKVIAKHFSTSSTESSIEHRFRKVKDLANRQKKCVAEGKDPENLEVEKGGCGTPSKTESPAVSRSKKKAAAPSKKARHDSGDEGDGEEIHKYFGESTPGGIDWQFRDIKKLAKAQKDAVAKGESPANVLGSSATGTPSRARATPSNAGTVKTPGSRTSKKPTAATPASIGNSNKGSNLGTTPGSRKRSFPPLSDDSDGGDVDYSELDMEETPSRRKSKMQRPSATPSTMTVNENSSSRGGSVPDDDATPTGAKDIRATPNKTSFTSVNGGASGRSSLFGNGTANNHAESFVADRDMVDLTDNVPVIVPSPVKADAFKDTAIVAADHGGGHPRPRSRQQQQQQQQSKAPHSATSTTRANKDTIDVDVLPSSVMPPQDLTHFPMDDEMYDGEA